MDNNSVNNLMNNNTELNYSNTNNINSGSEINYNLPNNNGGIPSNNVNTIIENAPKPQNKIVIFIIIAVILVALGGGGYLLFTNVSEKAGKEDGNKQNEVEKNNGKYDTESLLKEEEYHLIYEPLDFTKSFWNEQHQDAKILTNREVFNNKFVFQVKGSSDEAYASDLALPYNPKFSIVYTDGKSSNSLYNIKFDINSERFFYPNTIMYNFDYAQSTELYVLDNDLNFNKIRIFFKHKAKTSKENGTKSELIEDTKEWAIYKYDSEKNTYFEAEYFLNKEDGDFICFKSTLNGIISDEEFDYFVKKFKENMKITILSKEDDSYYATLNDNKTIKVNDNMEINTENVRLYSWVGNSGYYSGALYTSIDFVHEIKLGLNEKINENSKYKPTIELREYKDGVEYSLESLLESSIFGDNITTNDLNYKNFKIKTVFSDDYDYGIVFRGFILELNNNYYLMNVYNVDNNSEDISKLAEYLFEKVIVLK